MVNAVEFTIDGYDAAYILAHPGHEKADPVGVRAK
jgi:hypothetical protein